MLDFIKDNRKPVITLGLVTVIAYVFYFLDEIKTTSVLVFGWGYAVPLVLAAMVGIIGERTGVVNIGIEGQMLMSAFASFFWISDYWKYLCRHVDWYCCWINNGWILGCSSS